MKKNSRNKNRRSQVSKPAKSGNSRYIEGMLELRFSNASGFHTPANAYRRKPKHANKGWD